MQLTLLPEVLRIQPDSAGQPAQELLLTRIANYLRPQESYYQILELQLHGGPSLRFSKRLRPAAGSLLALDAWTEALAQHLELARPVAAAPAAAGPLAGAAPAAKAPASGLLAAPPRIFARTVPGKVLAGLAGLAGVWLVLSGLSRLGGGHVPSAVFLLPILYLGYYYRARGVLKMQTKVLTGIQADRDNWRDRD